MRYFETLFKINPLKVELDAPLILQETAIIKDTVDNKILLRNIFVNVGTQDIVAIALKGSLQDVFGESVQYKGKDDFTYIYQDIKCEPNTIFGNKISIDLPQNVRKIDVSIEKVVLLDGTVWTSNPDNIVTIQRQYEIEASDEFVKSYDTNSVLPVFYYAENDSCWQCTCGQVNSVSDENCRNCLRKKEDVKEKYSKEYIEKAYDLFMNRKEQEKLLEINKQNVCSQDNNLKIDKKAAESEKAYKQKSFTTTQKYIVSIIGIFIAVILIIILAINIGHISQINKSKDTIKEITDLFGTQLDENSLDENGWENHGIYKLCEISGTAYTASITYSKKVQYVYWFSEDEYSQTEYENFVDTLTNALGKEPQEDETYDYRWEFDDYYVYGYKNPNNLICAIFCSIDEDDWSSLTGSTITNNNDVNLTTNQNEVDRDFYELSKKIKETIKDDNLKKDFQDVSERMAYIGKDISEVDEKYNIVKHEKWIKKNDVAIEQASLFGYSGEYRFAYYPEDYAQDKSEIIEALYFTWIPKTTDEEQEILDKLINIFGVSYEKNDITMYNGNEYAMSYTWTDPFHIYFVFRNNEGSISFSLS